MVRREHGRRFVTKVLNMNIYQSISAVMAEIDPIAKARRNEQQNYGFRGIDDMYNALNPILPKYGIFFAPNVLSKEREERATKSGGVLMYTILMVKYTVYAADGTNIKLVTIGEAMDSGDKSSNKAMSTALKYAVMQLFCIPTEGDNDTENHSPEPAPKAPVASPSALGSSEDWNLEKAGATLVTLKGATKAIKDWDDSARNWMAANHKNPMVVSAVKYYIEHEIPFE